MSTRDGGGFAGDAGEEQVEDEGEVEADHEGDVGEKRGDSGELRVEVGDVVDADGGGGRRVGDSGEMQRSGWTIGADVQTTQCLQIRMVSTSSLYRMEYNLPDVDGDGVRPVVLAHERGVAPFPKLAAANLPFALLVTVPGEPRPKISLRVAERALDEAVEVTHV